MKSVKMPSGATLKIGHPPFEISKALYQSMLDEVREKVRIDNHTLMADVYKDVFCLGFASKKVEACLWDCFQHCTYEGASGPLKIDKDTFEPLSAREDYMTVCIEVAKEVVSPFVKSLYAKYEPLIQKMLNDQL
jgi:hypothetical protein